MRNTVPKVVVLISGRGSNLQALIEFSRQHSAYDIVAVLSNKPNAGGLGVAREAGIPVVVLDHKSYPDREAFDAALAGLIDGFSPQWVVLAGFMRILTAGFVSRYEGRLVNIHPSLLPSFPGLNTHQQALDAGVRVHGATVHLVTAQLDHGPIVDQAVVPVLECDTAADLAERVLAVEHSLFPRALAALTTGKVVQVNGKLQGVHGQSLIHSLLSATETLHS